MNIAIAGGSGFIGRRLTKYLVSKGHHIFILTRRPTALKKEDGITYVEWLTPDSHPENQLHDIDVIINLAGESLNSGRWTNERKQKILESRLTATNEIIQLIKSMDKKPNVLLNASAIGFYGTSKTKTFTENDVDSGNDFLAQTTKSWEDKAKEVQTLGVRLVLARFGVVLAKEDGALPRMVMPYKFFVGGKVGSGEQWLSWIHIDDVVRLVEFAITNETIQGPLNITAPQPEKMNTFGKTIGKVLGRPHLVPAPGFALKLLLGEMSILVLEGQKVLPVKATKDGFSFKYRQLEKALQDILK